MDWPTLIYNLLYNPPKIILMGIPLLVLLVLHRIIMGILNKILVKKPTTALSVIVVELIMVIVAAGFVLERSYNCINSNTYHSELNNIFIIFIISSILSGIMLLIVAMRLRSREE